METPCIEWQGYCQEDGYGYVGKDGRYWLAHRLAWTEAYGPIPDGQVVRHRCDNPPCVRLDHLELGTQADNVRDRDTRGAGPWNSRKTHCKCGRKYTHTDSTGRRKCRTCNARWQREYRARRRALEVPERD